MEKENLNGQSAKAASAQENENINYADTMYDAFLKSMTWFVNGKGVVMTVKYTNTNVWVEKSTTENGIIYKFVVENGAKKRFIEVNSATWSDYSLFSGDMLKIIATELYRLIHEKNLED